MKRKNYGLCREFFGAWLIKRPKGSHVIRTTLSVLYVSCVKAVALYVAQHNRQNRMGDVTCDNVWGEVEEKRFSTTAASSRDVVPVYHHISLHSHYYSINPQQIDFSLFTTTIIGLLAYFLHNDLINCMKLLGPRTFKSGSIWAK